MNHSRHHLTTQLRLCGLAIMLGTISAVAGIGLLKLIHFITNLSFHGMVSFEEREPSFMTFGWLAVFVPAAGGLIIGWIARYFCPEVRGHGIPEAMQGVVANQSRISLKTALLKPLCTALSIGTGGPFGAEGPVIATGGAIGSLMGQWLPNSPRERKILLAAGAAAGMTAVFGTPLAGALLAVELLLFEFSAKSLIPVAMAAGTSMAVRGIIGEPFPMLPLKLTEAPGLITTAGATIVGMISGLASVGLTHALHSIEGIFEKLPIDWKWWPALGGLAVGIIGWIDPRTLGPGYQNLRDLLNGDMMLPALLLLGFLKFASWSICLGSGTAGGTLAPVMTLGGVGGALTARALEIVPGFETFPPGLAALVGMAAIFAGASRALLASAVFAFEATHADAAFGPLLLGCASAVLVSRILMKDSLMTEKLSKQGIHVPDHYEPDILASCRVAQVMDRHPLILSPDMPVRALIDQVAQARGKWSSTRLFPVVDARKTLLGVVGRADILAAPLHDPALTVSQIAVSVPHTLFEEDPVSEAADKMILRGIGSLPVVTRDDSPRLLGILNRHDVLKVRSKRTEQEIRPSRLQS